MGNVAGIIGSTGDGFGSFTTGQQLEIGGNILGGLVQAIGQKNEGDAQSEALSQRAAILRSNALLQEREATLRLKRGRQEVQQRQRQREQDVGDITADAAGRGIVVDQDTQREVILATIAAAKRDEVTLSDNAWNEALAIRHQGAIFEKEAQFADETAARSSKAGIIAAAGTVVTTAGTVAAKWLTFNADAAANAPLGATEET